MFLQEKERLAKQAAEEEGDMEEEGAPKPAAGKKSKGPQASSPLPCQEAVMSVH